MLNRNLESVRARINAACQRSGRDPSSVILVAVTKTVPVEVIRQAAELGLTDIGENRVQEAGAKHEALRDAARSLRWHLVGHLQSNKARYAVELFDVIHSVDSVSLVDELERQAAKRTRTVDVLIQVNVSGEATKNGCRADDAGTVAKAVQDAQHLTLKGLMTIPPFFDNPEAARPVFQQLHQLRETVAASVSLQPSALRLSMGMSHDFEIAIEEGADIVRIGSAIFGAQAA